MKYKKAKLKDIIFFNPKETIKKNQLAKKIPMDALIPFTRKVGYYEVKEFNSGTKFRNNDTLMARITPCLENGKTAYVNILDEDEIAFGSTEYFVLRADENYILPKYLYYISISDELRNTVIKSMTGTSGRQRAQKESVLDFEIELPSISIQKKVLSILDSIDSKIEINNQIISNLEELASTLFKRWFVDFEFPDENGKPYKSSGGKMVDSELGEIPESWEVNKIGNMDIVVSDHVANGSFKSLKENVKILEDKSYALFLRNVDLKAELRGTLRYIDKASYDFLKKTHLFGGEVIISNVGDVGTVHLVPKNDKKMVLGNNQIYLNSKIENMNTYLYLFFKSVKGQELIKSITSGSVQMKFNKTDFRNLKIVFPLLDNFNIFSELLGNIRVKKNENNILRDTRDSLLPKLLSGEIELPEDEEM